MKRFLLIFFVLLSCFVMTGCSIRNMVEGLLGKDTGTTSNNQQKKVIALALDEKDPNRTLILRGIKDMAEKEELEIKVIKESDSEGGKEEESSLKGAKALIYKGGDKKLLQMAEKDNIPIITINELPPGVEIAGIIIPDPREIGELMAKSILTEVSEGQVIYLQGDPGDSTAQETLAALKTSLSTNPKISLHSISSPTGSEGVAIQELSEYLANNSDKVKIIVANNEKLLSQAIELIKKLKLQNNIKIVGGEANSESLNRMIVGDQLADIDTSPYIQGVNAFQWAQKIMNKEALDITESVTSDQGEVPAKVIPVKPVTPENLAVIQKTYTKATEKEQQEEEKDKEKNKVNQGKDKQEKQGSDDQNSQKGNSEESSSRASQGSPNLPKGVKKVKETVKTEIIREYLDAEGNILGTEKNANNQVRTIPPEMLMKESGQGGQGEKQGQDKEEGQQGDDGGQGK